MPATEPQNVRIPPPYKGMRYDLPPTSIPADQAVLAHDLIPYFGGLCTRPAVIPHQTPYGSYYNYGGKLYNHKAFLHPADESKTIQAVKAASVPIHLIVNNSRYGTSSEFGMAGDYQVSFDMAQRKLFAFAEDGASQFVDFTTKNPPSADSVYPIVPPAPVVNAQTVQVGVGPDGNPAQFTGGTDVVQHSFRFITARNAVSGIHVKGSQNTNGANFWYRYRLRHPGLCGLPQITPGTHAGVAVTLDSTSGDAEILATGRVEVFRQFINNGDGVPTKVLIGTTGLELRLYGKTSIVSASRVGAAYNVQLSVAGADHGVGVGDYVSIWGTGDPDYLDGDFQVNALATTVLLNDTLQIVVPAAGNYSSATGWAGRQWEVDDNVAKTDAAPGSTAFLDTDRSPMPMFKYGFWDGTRMWGCCASIPISNCQPAQLEINGNRYRIHHTAHGVPNGKTVTVTQLTSATITIPSGVYTADYVDADTFDLQPTDAGGAVAPEAYVSGYYHWDKSDGLPHRAYYSTGDAFGFLPDVLDPHWWNAATDSFDFGAQDGEHLLGGLKYGNVKIFFKPNSVWMLSGNSREDFVDEQLTFNIGACGPKAFALAHDGSVYFLHTSGFYRLRGREVQRIEGPIDFAFNEYSSFPPTAMHFANVIPCPLWNGILVNRWGENPRTSTADKPYFYHIPTGTWWYWTAQVAAGSVAQVPTDVPVLGTTTKEYRQTYLAINGYRTLAGGLGTELAHYVGYVDGPLVSYPAGYSNCPTRGSDVLPYDATHTADFSLPIQWQSGSMANVSQDLQVHYLQLDMKSYVTVGTYAAGNIKAGCLVDGTNYLTNVPSSGSPTIIDGALFARAGTIGRDVRWLLQATGGLNAAFGLYVRDVSINLEPVGTW